MGIALRMGLVNVSRNCWREFSDSSLSICHFFLGPLSCYFILWFRDILNARVIFLLCHLSTIVHPCSFVHLFSSSCCIQSVLPLQVSSLSSL